MCLIDGMAGVRKLKVDHFSFGEITDTALARVLREGGSNIRIGIVSDGYINLSIKSSELERTKRPRGLDNL